METILLSFFRGLLCYAIGYHQFYFIFSYNIGICNIFIFTFSFSCLVAFLTEICEGTADQSQFRIFVRYKNTFINSLLLNFS